MTTSFSPKKTVRRYILTTPETSLRKTFFSWIKQKIRKKLNETINFKRFVVNVAKHQDHSKKIAELNIFQVERALKSTIGKRNYKITRCRSGILLNEVDQKQLYEKLLKIKKLDDIPVLIEDQKFLNTSKGVFHCDGIKGLSNEEIQDELREQQVTEVYRIQKRHGEGHISTDTFIVTFGNPVLPKELKIGYINVQVNEYIPNPRRCFKCQR